MESLCFISIDGDGFVEPPTPSPGLVTHADKMAKQGEGGHLTVLPPRPKADAPIHAVLLVGPEAPEEWEAWHLLLVESDTEGVQRPLESAPHTLHSHPATHSLPCSQS